MRLTEEQLRNVIKETIEETLFGLSMGNFARNGHLHVNSKSPNPVIQAAWKIGWELEKEDEENIEGEYEARIMDGAFNDIEPDRGDIEGIKHPKVSWPMLIAMLNKQFRGQGLSVRGSNYHTGYEGLGGKETDRPGVQYVKGIITVTRQ